jgi:hypothetical protein
MEMITSEEDVDLPTRLDDLREESLEEVQTKLKFYMDKMVRMSRREDIQNRLTKAEGELAALQLNFNRLSSDLMESRKEVINQLIENWYRSSFSKYKTRWNIYQDTPWNQCPLKSFIGFVKHNKRSYQKRNN